MVSSRQVDNSEDLAAAIAWASTPASIVASTAAASTSLGRVSNGLLGSAGLLVSAGLLGLAVGGAWEWGNARWGGEYRGEAWCVGS